MGFKFDHAPIDPFAGAPLVAWMPQEELQMLQPPTKKKVKDEDLDDEDLEDEEEDDDEEDDDEEDDDDPAELRKQLDQANARLARAGRKLAASKRKGKKTDDDETPPSKRKKADEEDDDVETKVSRAVAAIQERADLRAKKTGLRSLLKEEGVDSAGISLLLGVVKFDDFDVDDDGDLEGADDVLDELREKYGSLFGRKEKLRTRRINGDDDSSEKGDKRKPMTATEAQAHKLKTGSWPRGFKPPTS